jgi:23S rRNA (uracil-5-)-methyltransferase RumA
MEYSFSVIRYDLEEEKEYDDFGLGFKHRGTWWCVENMDKDSGLFDAEFENNLNKIRVFCEETGLPAWHPPKRHGFFRHLVVRKSYHSNELLINLITSSDGLENFDINGFLKVLQSILGERLGGLFHTLNDDTGDRTNGTNLKGKLVYGKEKITEQILGLNFEISMQSFFQTNPKSAEKLYSKVAEYALENNSINKGDVVMDLFCGTGTIGQILASKTENTRIVGVDIVPEAIADAKENAKRNLVDGLEFYAADVGKFLVQYPQYKGKISCIVLDPPRAGIAPKTLKKVIEINAKKIVYVSCNPATQARDTEILNEAGYQLSKFSLVDQFPHTSHIESIAVFEK